MLLLCIGNIKRYTVCHGFRLFLGRFWPPLNLFDFRQKEILHNVSNQAIVLYKKLQTNDPFPFVYLTVCILRKKLVTF